MRKIVLVFALLLALFGGHGIVSAHAVVTACAPLIGANLPQPPALLICQFNQPLDESKSTITVTDAQGQRVDKNDTKFFEGDKQTLVVSLDTTKMKAGIYTAHWNVTDTLDYGNTFGDIQFGVNTVVPPTPTPALPGVAMTPTPTQTTDATSDLISRFLIGAGVIVLAALGVLFWRMRTNQNVEQE
ncbi:MAG TPA: copper resistance protein CopC [Anaerolineae bacterium]|nr:copper resistance protein CopC [Anaerolineae bacterium]